MGSRSPRFNLWAAFLVFSTITLGSAVQVKNASEPVSTANKYIVACAIVTFVFTTVIVALHFFPSTTTIFVGTKVEGVVIFVLVAFWTAIVAENTDAGDGLAPIEEGSDAVQNANLYYFSWAGFITSIILLVSYLRDAFGVDMVGNVTNRSARLQWWAGLLASSLIVMGSASHVHRTDCQWDSEGTFSGRYCTKTKFAITAGALGVFFVLLVVFTKVLKYTAADAVAPFMLEFATAVLLTIINAFNVGYTTSADAPGSAVGNLYYFSWAMFLISGVLMSECYTENAHPSGDTQAQPGGENENGEASDKPDEYRGDIEVETFDDNI